MKNFRKKGISVAYIEIIKDMYEDAMTKMKMLRGLIKVFSIKIELHQGSTLSLYLFTLIIDELIKHIQNTVP